MINLSLGFPLLLILIFQDIVILNEETLILLCFIIFNWLLYTNYGLMINQILQTRSDLIERTLIKSFDNNYSILEINKNKQKNLINLKQHFKGLKHHLIIFNIYMLNILPNYHLKLYQLLLLKKLTFSKNLEQQTFKLILLLLLKKIEKLIFTHYFYINKLKVKYFIALSKISTRESFELIK